jgi:predicted nucleic acid-binding protein
VIVVDSSVWIDHLRRAEAQLSAELEAGRVLCHPFVAGELACGHLRRREQVLSELALLPEAPAATHAEALAFLQRHGLHGRGIGWIDAHLLTSTALARPATLWTHDKRLAAVAAELHLDFDPTVR